MKSEKFKRELNMIVNSDVREFAKTALDNLPDYFFEVAASSTGKYHPSYALGEGGLVRHTCAAVRFANHLFQLEQFQNQFSERDRDLVITAILLHDGWKHGDKGSKFTTFEHPQVAADWVRNSECIETYLPLEDRETIAKAIESHMGQWNVSNKSKTILKKPENKIQKFVHMCDYLASRKDIEVLFDDYSVPEIPDINTYVLNFGKHNGKTLPEIAEVDPSYISWAKENMRKEPIKSLLKLL